MRPPKTPPSKPLLHPLQVEVLRFNLDQVRALASPVRAGVFWSYSPYEPKSVSDIAHEIGKSAQTVHYHTNALQELGLIVAVDQRKKRSRMEDLYLRKGRESLDSGTEGSEEYNRLRWRGFKLESLKMVRESAAFYELLPHDPSIHRFSFLRKTHARLSMEQVAEIRAKVVAIIAEAVENQTPEAEGGKLVNLVFHCKPTRRPIEGMGGRDRPDAGRSRA